MRRAHDDSVKEIAILAGLSPPLSDLGNIRETHDFVESQEIRVRIRFVSIPSNTHSEMVAAPGRCRTAELPHPLGLLVIATVFVSCYEGRQSPDDQIGHW